MKVCKLISLVTVVGISLWGSTVHAQNMHSRTVDLDCIGGNQGFGFFCGPGGVKGQLVIQRWEMGANNNQSGFIPGDGEPHPFFELNVSLMCQDVLVTNNTEGPQQFYVLRIAINGGDPVRVITFNPFCFAVHDRIGGRLPDVGDPDLWLTGDLEVTVTLEADDDDNSIHDAFSVDVMEGFD